MRHPNFWTLIVGKVISAQGISLGVASVLIGLFYKPQWKVSGGWFVLALAFAAFVLIVLGSALLEVWARLKPNPPRVKNVMNIVWTGEPRVVFLVEASDEFSQESIVSVYRKHEDFELFFGIGHVFVIQANGLIQVMIDQLDGTDQDFDLQVRTGNVNAIGQLIVKPTIPRSMLFPQNV